MLAPNTAPNGPQLLQASGRATIFVPFTGGVPLVVGARRSIGPTGAAAPRILLGLAQWFHLIGVGLTVLTDVTDATGGLGINAYSVSASNNGNNVLGNLADVTLPDPGIHTPSAALQSIILTNWEDKWFRSDDFQQATNPSSPWNALQFFITVTNIDGAAHPFNATWQLIFQVFNELATPV